MSDAELFNDRPIHSELCPRCRGTGHVVEGHALVHLDSGKLRHGEAQKNAVIGFVMGSSSIWEAAREASEIASRAKRPVAFDFIDRVVVVNPGDDPDLVARVWWFQEYGETTEATWARR